MQQCSTCCPLSLSAFNHIAMVGSFFRTLNEFEAVVALAGFCVRTSVDRTNRVLDFDCVARVQGDGLDVLVENLADGSTVRNGQATEDDSVRVRTRGYPFRESNYRSRGVSHNR